MRISDWSSDVCSSDLLGFLEGDVLARHRIVLAELQLLRGGAGVLLGDVVVAGVGGANQLDQNSVLLGHGLTSIAGGSRGRAPPYWLAGGCQASARGLQDWLKIGRASCRARVCQYV